MNNDKLVKIDNFEGPYENKYLSGFAPGTHDKKFKTLEEAITNCLNNKFCTGITYTRNGFYTLRKGVRLLDSDKQKRFKNKEITWVKDSNYIIPEKKKSNRNIFNKENILIQEINEKNKYNPDDLYEIISIKGNKYYYNIKNRNILDLDGSIIGELIRGKLIIF